MGKRNRVEWGGYFRGFIGEFIERKIEMGSLFRESRVSFKKRGCKWLRLIIIIIIIG
jgi:hypothetical protein